MPLPRMSNKKKKEKKNGAQTLTHAATARE